MSAWTVFIGLPLAYISMRWVYAEQRTRAILSEAFWFTLYGGLILRGVDDAAHHDYAVMTMALGFWALVFWLDKRTRDRDEYLRVTDEEEVPTSLASHHASTKRDAPSKQ